MYSQFKLPPPPTPPFKKDSKAAMVFMLERMEGSGTGHISHQCYLPQHGTRKGSRLETH